MFMTIRIALSISLIGLAFAGCADAPDGEGASTTPPADTTPPTVTPPAADPTPAPTSECIGTPVEDGLPCTTWTCDTATKSWSNVSSCAPGFACGTSGCVQVAPTAPVCGDGKCEDTKGECTQNCLSDCPAPPVTPTCGDKTCNNGETTATCPTDCPAPPVVLTKPVMTCAINGSNLTVTFTGPVDKGFASAPPSTSASSNLYYGSNEDASGRLGWTIPYDAGQKPTIHWSGEGTQIVLSSQANAFNFVTQDENGQHWFGLAKWEIKGDCVLCDPAHVDKNICRTGNQRVY